MPRRACADSTRDLAIVMNHSLTNHASAVVMAAGMAKTPLAVAEAGAIDPSIMFVNAAFPELLDSDASSWIGRPLSALSTPTTLSGAPGTTKRFDVMLADGRRLPVALSVASVSGADGTPLCLLCSLGDARGDGADEAIERDAEMLTQVANAASELMGEAAEAARISASDGSGHASGEIALEAMRRTADPIHGSSS